jgi:CheY-like chemotaxis protein
MASLVDKTLKTTRLETGHFPFEFGLADLAALVREVLARRPEDRRHPIDAEIPEDPIPVWADRDRLAEVVENLLSNAAKYSPDGGAIQLQIRVVDEVVSVRVEDQGVGIAAEHMGRLFRPFSRIRTPRTAGIDGSGLGLYICERVVRAHGGRIWAESEPGHGSVFRFDMPVFGVAAQTRPPVVLVAAGDEGTRREVRRIGEELGYAVEEARDGLESVDAAIRLRPAAIVLDRILPRLRAEEVAERLREIPATAELPLFVLAAPEDLGDNAQLFRGCLMKPLDRAQLQAALEALYSSVR